MKRHFLFHLLIAILFLACSKSELKPHAYWNNLVNEKQGEIISLVQSVSCSDIAEFEIVKRGGYYLVHPSIRADFDKLQTELEQLEKERSIAAAREDLIGGPAPSIPTHPVRKVCDNGKPKLIYVKDLSLDEINAELPARYNELITFYKDEVCSDATQWGGRYIFADCAVEPIAIHKTIRNEEMVSKIDIYNQMMMVKILHEKKECDVKVRFEKVFEYKLVVCKDGKPTVID